MEVSSNHSTIKINAEFLRLSAVNSLKCSTCVYISKNVHVDIDTLCFIGFPAACFIGFPAACTTFVTYVNFLPLFNKTVA